MSLTYWFSNLKISIFQRDLQLGPLSVLPALASNPVCLNNLQGYQKEGGRPLSWEQRTLPEGCPPDRCWDISVARQQPHQHVPICLSAVLKKQNSKSCGKQGGSPVPWDTKLKCKSVGMEEGQMCDMLGQTRVNSLGNLADLTLFCNRFKWEGCKTVGWALEKHKAAVLSLRCGPVTRRAPHWDKGEQVPRQHGVCMAADVPRSKGSPWMFPTNPEDIHKT